MVSRFPSSAQTGWRCGTRSPERRSRALAPRRLRMSRNGSGFTLRTKGRATCSGFSRVPLCTPVYPRGPWPVVSPFPLPQPERTHARIFTQLILLAPSGTVPDRLHPTLVRRARYNGQDHQLKSSTTVPEEHVMSSEDYLDYCNRAPFPDGNALLAASVLSYGLKQASCSPGS